MSRRVLPDENLTNFPMIPFGTWSRVTRLWIVFGFNLALMGALAAVGIIAHSIGVLAEGVDYFGDAAGIAVVLVAIKLSKQRGTSKSRSRHPNATKWAALVNGGWLLILTLLVSVGAVDRLVSGSRPVKSLPVLIVSGVAALVMLVGALILGGKADDDGDNAEGGDFHMRAVLLDTAADAVAAATVAVTAFIMLATHGWYWLDPVVALVVSVVIGFQLIPLLRRTARSLWNDQQRPGIAKATPPN